MSVTRMLGAVLLAAGILGLVYGGFSYTRESHEVDLGPLDVQVQEKERVNVPLWAGIAAIVLGGVLLATGRR